MSRPLVVLVTGASRGIGRALCDELARRGHRVYGGARSGPGSESSPRFTWLRMDVLDQPSVNQAVERVVCEQGRLDVLVNNAGISQAGAVEDTPLETARAVFETNYLGTVRVIKAALPCLREAGSGTIVIVGSAAGRIGIPFQAHYAASKFALEGLAEALFHELREFGIRVLLLEPGDVRTGIWRDTMQAKTGPAYLAAMERFLKIKEREMGERATPPAEAARRIADVIASPGLKLRRPLARGARLILLARKILPESMFLRAVGRNYGIK